MKYEETKIIEKTKEICKENYPFCNDCPFSEYTGYDEEGNPDNECIFNCSNNEKTAEQMFKELGYEKASENEYSITYLRKLDYVATYIEFLINKKEIDFANANFITYDELQAINKKVEELQWN